MKAFLIIVVLGIIAFLVIPLFREGRVAGPLSPPVHITYRRSNILIGIVAVIQNQSDGVLYDLSAKVRYQKTGSVIDIKLTDSLQPASSKELGWMEMGGGWLDAGDEVSIYARGYPAPCTSYCNGREE